MKISIRLMGMLKDKEPPGNVLQLSDHATVEAAMRQLQIDPAAVHVFTVNGSLQNDKRFELSDDDELMVFPPVGGG